MRYNVYNFAHMVILIDVPMLVLVRHDFVKTEKMQDTVIALNVGDEQESDRKEYFIRRIS